VIGDLGLPILVSISTSGNLLTTFECASRLISNF